MLVCQMVIITIQDENFVTINLTVGRTSQSSGDIFLTVPLVILFKKHSSFTVFNKFIKHVLQCTCISICLCLIKLPALKSLSYTQV